MAEEFSVQIRLPETIQQGEVVEVKAKIRHLSRTGLTLVEDATTPYERFRRAEAAVYVKTVEVYYGADLISTFEMNSSTSVNPLLAFRLKATQAAPLRVVATDHEGKVVEATSDVKFA